MTETDAADLVVPTVEARRRPGARWKGIIGLAGIGGLVLATWATAREAEAQTLPSVEALLIALLVQTLGMVFAARAWVALFPPSVDRHSLAAGLYTSQLTKYLPAGGFVQAASQVALASPHGGAAAAALRLPVFSLCTVAAGATVGSVLVFDSELPAWGRALAAAGLLSVGLLHRSVLARTLALARRVVRRLPEPAALPPQRAILESYAFAIGNLAGIAAAFAVLLGDLADVNHVTAAAALSAGWAVGYLILFIPSGIGVREAVILAALPHVATATLLAASVAHRLLGLVAEAALVGATQLRAAVARRRSS